MPHLDNPSIVPLEDCQIMSGGMGANVLSPEGLGRISGMGAAARFCHCSRGCRGSRANAGETKHSFEPLSSFRSSTWPNNLRIPTGAKVG